MSLKISLTAAVALVALQASADIVQAGSGSYTTVFPGNDAAGRNSFPNATPLVTGNAALRPVPTNDWWSPKLTTAVPNNMFNYPLGVRTLMEGFDMQKTMTGQSQSVEKSILMSTTGVTNAEPKVSGHTDWTVTFNRTQDGKWMEATYGVGMPMAYFTKSDNAGDVTVSINGQASVDGNILLVKGSYNGASFAIYAPSGSTWTVNGKTATSNLGGRNYWSAVMLPDNVDALSQAKAWASSAFAFPVDTRAEWTYDPAKGGVTTRYVVTVDNKEGSGKALMGLLPHHWANLDGSFTVPAGAPEYKTIRGQLKMVQTNEFSTWLPFHGILPTLPPVADGTGGFSIAELKSLTSEVINDTGFQKWTDSYNDGQLLNRQVQTARIADEAGLAAESEKLRANIRTRLEKWLSCNAGDIAFMFYYHEPYGTLLGYPAGHGQDSNVNDHHFHWGYIIGAAAYIAQTDPAWGAKWGPMVDLLVRDAASADRNDPMFPYQRSFSPYAGHCWANGFASLGLGNDQESTSESMQFHSNLLHWAEVTGNKALRDQAIYMYVTEQSAVNEYWFDIEHRNFDAGYTHFIASRVFTNDYDYKNFWGAGAEGSLGIHIYPIHAGSFYLADNAKWAAEFWRTMCNETGILSKEQNGDIWYDSWWKFLAMLDAEKAIKLYTDYTYRDIKFGVSQAQTYQWLYAMASLGRANRRLTADCPMAMAFDKGDVRTYAVHNYSSADITVKFSDGFTMTAKAGKLTTATGKNPDPVEDLDIPDVPDPTPVVPVVVPAAPAPKHDAANVKSVFSDAYTSVAPALNVGSWNQSTVGAIEACGGNDAYKFSKFNYVGLQVDENNGTVDVSDMKYLHVDLFAPVAMDINIYPISLNPTHDKDVVKKHLEAGEWKSFDILLSDFPNVKFADFGQIKFDGGNGSQTFYLDNLYFWTDGEGGDTPVEPDPVDPDVIPAAPAPEHAAGDVKSFFSGKYEPAMSGMFVGGWGQATKHSVVTLGDGDEAYKFENFNYFGFQMPGDATVDVSDMEYLHVDLYAPEAMSLRIVPISLNPTVDDRGVTKSLEAGKWNSFDIALSEFSSTLSRAAGDVDFTKLGQFKFDGGSGQTFYLDNLYLRKAPGTTTGIADAENVPVIFRRDGSTAFIYADGRATVHAYTADGRAVTAESFADTAVIDMSAWASGVYIILVDTPRGSRTFRIIK